MAFKLTPGLKGNPAMNRIKNLGACGGPGQQPCEPRFQKEVEEKRMRATDRSSSSISKYSEAKIKKPPIKYAPPKPAPAPKLQINLPKGYEFKDKLQEKMFMDMISQGIEKGKYETQEDLDNAIMKQLKAGGPSPFDPKDPVLDAPFDPKEEEPIVKPPGKLDPVLVAPIKGGSEFEASPIKSVIKK